MLAQPRLRQETLTTTPRGPGRPGGGPTRAFPPAGDVATAYLARGDVFADAVASGSLTDGPVLLVGSCGPLPDAVTAYLTAAAVDTVIALGGTQAVCDQVLTDAADLPDGGTPPPGTTPTPGPVIPNGVLDGTLYFHEFSNYESLAMGSLADQAQPEVIYVEDANVDFSTQLTTREFVYLRDPAAGSPTVVIRTLDAGLDETGGFVWQSPTPDGGSRVPGSLTTPQLSPDGLYLVAGATYGDDEQVTELLDRYGNHVVSVSRAFLNSGAWTPDGDLLVAATDPATGERLLGVVTVADLIADGEAATVAVLQRFAADAAIPYGLTYAADGSQIAYGQDGDLWVVANEPGAAPHRLAFGAGAVPLIDFAFEPDAETIAVLYNNRGIPPTNTDASTLHLVPNHRGEAIEVTSPGPTQVAIGPDAAEVEANGQLTWSPEPERPLPQAVPPPAEPPRPPLPDLDGRLTTTVRSGELELAAAATDLADLAATTNPTGVLSGGNEDSAMTDYGAFDFEPTQRAIVLPVGTGFPDAPEVVIHDLDSGEELDRLLWRVPVDGSECNSVVWSSHMKTTLNLDDELLRRAKAHAARRGGTLTAVIEEALRSSLDASSRRQDFRLRLPTVRGMRPPSVDPGDRDALHDRMANDA